MRKYGATDNNKAVVLDCINCSDQLIKKKGNNISNNTYKSYQND